MSRPALSCVVSSTLGSVRIMFNFDSSSYPMLCCLILSILSYLGEVSSASPQRLSSPKAHWALRNLHNQTLDRPTRPTTDKDGSGQDARIHDCNWQLRVHIGTNMRRRTAGSLSASVIWIGLSVSSSVSTGSVIGESEMCTCGRTTHVLLGVFCSGSISSTINPT